MNFSSVRVECPIVSTIGEGSARGILFVRRPDVLILTWLRDLHSDSVLTNAARIRRYFAELDALDNLSKLRVR
jgi:hypothetical protein